MQWVLRLRVTIIVVIAMLLISAAVLFSVSRAVLPYTTGYKNEIQQEISQQTGLPVEIDSIDAAIHWFSPSLKLIDVTIYDKRHKVPLFNFKEAFVELDVIASIFHGELIVNDVGLVGTDISIEKLSENEWLVQGIKFTSQGSSELPDRFLYILQNSDYLLHDSNIYYQDHTGEKLNISLLDINIDVRNHFDSHNIKVSINLPEEYGRSLSVVANLTGEPNALDGDIYVDAQKLNVKQWNAKFRLFSEYQLNAIVDASFWASLEDSNIQSLTTQLASTSLRVKNNATNKRWRTDYLSANVRYVDDGNNRNIAVSDFYFGEKSKSEWPLHSNAVINDDGQGYSLSADFLSLLSLQEIAEVFLSKEQLADFHKLSKHKVRGDVYNLNLHLPRLISGQTSGQQSVQQLRDKLYLDATVNNLSFENPSANNRIALTGIDGSLHYENRQAILELASRDTVIDFKDLFRSPLTAESILGKVLLDYQEDNWRIYSDQLQVKNRHIDTVSRLDMQQLASGQIFADLQTDFYNADGKYTSQYLPVGIMHPKLVNWLDMAVHDGRIPEGSFILHGNLGDFPYRNHDGVFQVLFPLRNASLTFLKQWPPLTGASATVKFNDLSLSINNVNAKSGGASMSEGRIEIADLTNPHLTVNTHAHGRNEDIQWYIWHSPLDDVLGDTMRLFQFEGASDLALKIDVPLAGSKPAVAVEGRLNLVNSKIYYPVLGYEMKDVNGVINFTGDSIFANSLKAKIQGNTVSINAFTRNGDSGNEAVFHLDGVLGVDYLLQHFNWIPKDWLSGQSKWSIDIATPYHPKDYLAQITASSALQGVTVQVSDRVNKPAAEARELNAEIDVLRNSGVHVVAKGVDKQVVKADTENTIVSRDILQLYADRDEDRVWSFNVYSQYLKGKGEVSETLTRETPIKLDLEEADVYSLFASENRKKSEAVKPSDLPAFDWKIKKALWKDWVFSDVKVDTSWHKHGMVINKFSLHGAAMDFDADGAWLTSWRGLHSTVLRGKISGDNLGEALAGLGFQRSLDRCDYNSTFNLKWSAEPYNLSWANLGGESSFEMSDGEIVDVDPGAGGRLLGLLNIFKLANRLVFDFDDVVRKGFSFDSIKGGFEFDHGHGNLNTFDVSAPAADIKMFGGIGMIARDYDLLMRVKPHTDSLTFASGTLLGGVVIGAGLALIQKVFDIGVAQNVYSITGSWDDPVIKKIVEKSTEPEVETSDEDDF